MLFFLLSLPQDRGKAGLFPLSHCRQWVGGGAELLGEKGHSINYCLHNPCVGPAFLSS